MRGVKPVAHDVIFCGPRKDFLESANAWPANLVFEKLFSKRNKYFKLQCCRDIMVDNCYKSRVALQLTTSEINIQKFGDP